MGFQKKKHFKSIREYRFFWIVPFSQTVLLKSKWFFILYYICLFFQPTLKYIKKATKTIATTEFPATALVQPTQGLIAGDRGCLPTVSIINFNAQKANQQMALAVNNPDLTLLIPDYAAMTSLLCTTSGTCCTTDLCNKNNLCNKKA